ncbi:MAG: MOSC domain-containing protein [Rhodobacteraceae bacterium]|nr:MOSC domain-containing protein [Paracoccaceae bacterium]
MTGRLAHIWRYPVKSHGREALDRIEVTAGATLPWDRAWAVAHESAEIDGTTWAPCANFSRGAKAPGLMAIDATLDEASGALTLSHPDLEPVTVAPDREPAALIDWAAPLMAENRAASTRVVRVPGRGMTDTDFPSISLLNLSSLRALEQRLGQSLSPLRFRGNFGVDGLGPWEEFEWIGRRIRIGAVEFRVEERIKRCLATTANPETGRRDADTLGALENGWGHRDFGVYMVADTNGTVALGDPVELVQ